MEDFWNQSVGSLAEKLVSAATSLVGKLLLALVVLIVGRLLIKLVMKILRKGKLSSKADPTVARFLQNFIRISLNILLAVTVIAILGVPMSSVVALIASAGLAIGLALQGALSNFAGGIMILVFRPFGLDDFIEADGFSGTVKDIGIFYTEILTGDNKRITIPNGTVMNNAVVNYSKCDNRRVDMTFSVAYGTDVEKVKKILLEIAGKHEKALKDPAPFARLTKQNQSSLDFTLRVWTAKSDYWQVNFDILESVNARFQEEGIEVPFNQLDVHVKQK